MKVMKKRLRYGSLFIGIVVMGILGLWLYGDKTVESRHIDTDAMSDSILRESLMPEGDYVVYLLWGTLPNVYAGMHMQLHDKPSLMWAMRPQNFQLAYLPTHVEWIDDPAPLDMPDFVRSLKLAYGALEQRIDKMLEDNPDATFSIYMADSEAHWMINYYFINKGVSVDRLYVDFISEGSFTVNEYFNKYVWVIPGDSKIKDSLKWVLRKFFIKAAFRSDKKKVERFMHQSQSDIAALKSFGNSYSYATSLLYEPGRMWLFHGSEVFPIPYIANQLRLFPLPLSRFYRLLTLEEQKKFEQLVLFNKEEFDAVLFPEDDTRIPLIIIGTRLRDEDDQPYISATFREDMEELRRHFSPSEYRYFFKGHPALPYGNEEEATIMEELGFEALPNVNFPFELLLMSYPELIVGGYQSGTFISSTPEQLRFIIGSLTYQPMRYFYENDYWPYAIRINEE